MKPFAFRTLALAGLLWGAGAFAETPAQPPQTLTLGDLANRSDRWPASVTVKGDFRFGNGTVVHQGDKLRLAHFDGSKAVVVTPGNVLLAFKPEDCGLLDAANQAWAALTPAQRAVDPDSLVADPSLWPLQVTTATAITCQFGHLPAGSQVDLLTLSSRGATIAWPNSSNRVNLNLGDTDVFDRARQLVLVDPDKRPSRIAAALRKVLVDADGKPYQDDHLGDKKIFALYFGANWCAPCHAFSPDFVKFVDDAMPGHPELAVALMSEDKQPDQMLAYMKEEKMPFPAVPLSNWTQSSLLSSYAARIIPHLIVIDRFGKVLASNDDDSGNRGDPEDTIAALGKLLAAPANQP